MSTYIIAAAAFALWACLLAGWLLGRAAGRRAAQQDAVDHGLARWWVSDSREIAFVWEPRHRATGSASAQPQPQPAEDDACSPD